MRRLVPLVVLLTLAACAQAPLPAELEAQSAMPSESAIPEDPAASQGGGGGPGPGGGEWPPITEQSLARWASFPIGADPRLLVVLGQAVETPKFVEIEDDTAFYQGRVDANGKVPPEAAEAFAKMAKPIAGKPRVKVLSTRQGMKSFDTDRGPRELPAWFFELAGAYGPATVLAIKPDYQAEYPKTRARVSADGRTLTINMAEAPEPCPGGSPVIYQPRRLESPTAVAVGLNVSGGPVGTCAQRAIYRSADYTIKLTSPLGNRVLVDPKGNPIMVLTN
jgi:hypothetical protein